MNRRPAVRITFSKGALFWKELGTSGPHKIDYVQCVACLNYRFKQMCLEIRKFKSDILEGEERVASNHPGRLETWNDLAMDSGEVLSRPEWRRPST